MFSKALYKQSWKANGILWIAVTAVSTFILVILMSISGGSGMGVLTTSFINTITQDSLTSNFENSALNYYDLSNSSLSSFDKAFLDGYVMALQAKPFETPDEETISNAYLYALDDFQKTTKDKITEINPSYIEGTDEYQELSGVAIFALNPNGELSYIYEAYEEGSTPLEYDIISLIFSIDESDLFEIWNQQKPDNLYQVIRTPERISYRLERSISSSTIFLAGNMSSEEAKEKIIQSLIGLEIDEKTYSEFGFDYQGLKYIANSAILTYQARIDYEISQIDSSLADNLRQEKIKEIQINLRKEITANILNSLPDELSSLLSEMEGQDTYASTIGNIYFKIVGLLISIIYVIMTSVNLISGQVDSGSMAYILSTGTKRKTVTFTQAFFLFTSTLFLYIFTTIVSIICFKIATPVGTSVNIPKLVLYNLGSFLVTFALGGINFLTSCIFDRSKKAMAIGGGISVLTLVFTILGMFGGESIPSIMKMEVLNFFNYFSLITLFDDLSILNGTTAYLWKFSILVVIGIITSI
ncbi:MAG: ABC transporter permease subunit, partial [Bacilli bacterium]|nr:ABC transporter permease subunit [Bacilli bacterium]